MRALLVALLLVGCGGGGGGGGGGSGDKPAGDGTSVQKTAQITVHRAEGDTTIDYSSPPIRKN